MALFPDTFPAILKYSDLKLTVIAMTGPIDNGEPSDSRQVNVGAISNWLEPLDFNSTLTVIL